MRADRRQPNLSPKQQPSQGCNQQKEVDLTLSAPVWTEFETAAVTTRSGPRPPCDLFVRRKKRQSRYFRPEILNPAQKRREESLYNHTQKNVTTTAQGSPLG